ncbi:MAG: hypothetical protein ACLPXB_15655 [Thiobacillaceae bacterium]
MLERLSVVRDYHARTKHHLDHYAAGPDTLDWDAQPNPFRHWTGPNPVELPRSADTVETEWDDLNTDRPAKPRTLESVGTLLRQCAAISAWKAYRDAKWALRVCPSSGNLHPTEAYIIARGVTGLADGLYHYQSEHHCLEMRARELREGGVPGLWLGFSSIHWREAWKYGERAFRYCQLDLGHMLAAVSYAAALLGWRPNLLPMDGDAVAACLGLDRVADFTGVEPEEPEVILCLSSSDANASPPSDWGYWQGLPSLLDPSPMYQWPVIEAVAQATRGALPEMPAPTRGPSPPSSGASVRATEVILRRRSAQAFDAGSVMPRGTFRRIIASLLPGGSPVWSLWPAPPRVHPLLLVHRVEGLAPGVYALPRGDGAKSGLQSAMRDRFEWQRHGTLPLYQLILANSTNIARTLSCHQDIAAHGALTFIMVAEYADTLAMNPAAYRHLHWEAGMLGHIATLEAEAAGWRGTGIGCFFDDADHEMLGLLDDHYQVIYHYAIGVPVEDSRLTTLPAYG